jgi:hypothetical protein
MLEHMLVLCRHWFLCIFSNLNVCDTCQQPDQGPVGCVVCGHIHSRRRSAFEFMLVRNVFGFGGFHRIQFSLNNRCKEIYDKTRIHSGSRFNLLVMIGRTRDKEPD